MKSLPFVNVPWPSVKNEYVGFTEQIRFCLQTQVMPMHISAGFWYDGLGTHVGIHM